MRLSLIQARLDGGDGLGDGGGSDAGLVVVEGGSPFFVAVFNVGEGGGY